MGVNSDRVICANGDDRKAGCLLECECKCESSEDTKETMS